MLDLVAGAATLGVIAIETIADLRLHRRPSARGVHPKRLVSLAAAPRGWPCIAPGAVTISAMFTFASVPLMDQYSLERRGGRGL
ncbi:hypothetical protein [Oleomonas cavernae]|nr:hypothetical protein [Oleomonas cavernae]